MCKVPEHLKNNAKQLAMEYLTSVFDLKIKTENRNRQIMKLTKIKMETTQNLGDSITFK